MESFGTKQSLLVQKDATDSAKRRKTLHHTPAPFSLQTPAAAALQWETPPPLAGLLEAEQHVDLDDDLLDVVPALGPAAAHEIVPQVSASHCSI